MALGLLKELRLRDHKTLTTRQFRDNLAEALTFTSRDAGRIVLQKSGEDRVAIVSLTDLWILDALDDLDLKKELGTQPDVDTFMEKLADKLAPRVKKRSKLPRKGGGG